MYTPCSMGVPRTKIRAEISVGLQPASAAVGREPEDALALAATESTAEGATP